MPVTDSNLTSCKKSKNSSMCFWRKTLDKGTNRQTNKYTEGISSDFTLWAQWNNILVDGESLHGWMFPLTNDIL